MTNIASKFRQLGLALLAGIFAAGPALANDKVVLMLNWYPYGEHAPFYYGVAKGIYAAAGIDLEIQEGRGSGITAQVIAAKGATFGYVDIPTMMKAAIKGAPIVATGVLLQKSPTSVMGLVDSNIRKPEDIKGKTIAMSPGGANEQIWPLFLKKTGLKESDFKVVTGDGATKINSVINGRADLLLGYPMDQGMKILDATGKRVYPIKFADHGIHVVSSGIIANKDTVKANPDLVRRFMDASAKSVHGALLDPMAAVTAMLKTDSKIGKEATLLEGFKETSEFYGDDIAKKNPFRVSDELMGETVAIMVEYGGLDAVAKNQVKSFYSNEYLTK